MTKKYVPLITPDKGYSSGGKVFVPMTSPSDGPGPKKYVPMNTDNSATAANQSGGITIDGKTYFPLIGNGGLRNLDEGYFDSQDKPSLWANAAEFTERENQIIEQLGFYKAGGKAGEPVQLIRTCMPHYKGLIDDTWIDISAKVLGGNLYGWFVLGGTENPMNVTCSFSAPPNSNNLSYRSWFAVKNLKSISDSDGLNYLWSDHHLYRRLGFGGLYWPKDGYLINPSIWDHVVAFTNAFDSITIKLHPNFPGQLSISNITIILNTIKILFFDFEKTEGRPRIVTNRSPLILDKYIYDYRQSLVDNSRSEIIKWAAGDIGKAWSPRYYTRWATNPCANNAFRYSPYYWSSEFPSWAIIKGTGLHIPTALGLPSKCRNDIPPDHQFYPNLYNSLIRDYFQNNQFWVSASDGAYPYEILGLLLTKPGAFIIMNGGAHEGLFIDWENEFDPSSKRNILRYIGGNNSGRVSVKKMEVIGSRLQIPSDNDHICWCPDSDNESPCGFGLFK